jgi:mannosyltransferase
VLLAAAVRLPTLGQQSFWLDEGYTEHLVRMSLGGMLSTIPNTESTPPLYYVLAWGWTRVFGYSEAGLRSLSALAGILTVPVVYAAATRLASRRAGAIAGFLVALAPVLVWFSQEARAYALATLLSSITLLCLIRFLGDRDPRWLAGWAVSAGLGLATHYFVAFVVAPELGWLLWHHRRDRRVLLAVAFVAVVAGALVPLALAQRGTGHVDYISQGSLGRRLLQVPKQFLIGYASPGQVITGVAAALLVLAACAGALVSQRVERSSVLLPLTVGLTAVLLPVVLALVSVDFLNTRNLLPALPPLLIVVAIGVAALERWPLAFALGAVFLVVVVLVDTHARFQRDNWDAASRAIGPASTQPRALVVSPGSGLIPLDAYQARLRRLTGDAAVSELDVIGLASHATGTGIGAPPRPRGPLPVPAGFRLIRATYGDTYTVLHYRAPSPITVTAAGLAASRLEPGSPAVLVQP